MIGKAWKVKIFELHFTAHKSTQDQSGTEQSRQNDLTGWYLPASVTDNISATRRPDVRSSRGGRHAGSVELTGTGSQPCRLLQLLLLPHV